MKINTRVALFFAIVCSFSVIAQEEEPKDYSMRLQYGYSSYQEIPTIFENEANGRHSSSNLRRTGVYVLSATTGPTDYRYQFGVNLGYEISYTDLTQNGVSSGDLSVYHYTIMGQFRWYYFATEKWRIGGDFYLGAGWDRGEFSEGLEDFNYTQVDYHYQIDPVSISYGNKWGIEVTGGIGALGIVRGGMFFNF